MQLEDIRRYCLSKPQVSEELPFNEDTPVFKVSGKMFLLMNLVPPYSINLKCDPEYAIELRERCNAITPGFHMNKTHWNTVALDGTLKAELIKELIDHSYQQVIAQLPISKRNKLNR